MANNFFRMLSHSAFFGRVIPKPRWGSTTPATPFPPKPVSTPGTTPATPFPPKPVSTPGTTPATPFPPKPVSTPGATPATPFPPKPVSTLDTLTVVEYLHFLSSLVTVSTFVVGLGLLVQGKGEKEDELKQAKAEIIAEVQKVGVDIAELKNNLKKPNKWFWFW